MIEVLDLSEPVIEASQPYVGRWNRLVSTTNWEKGKIIVEWRRSLIAQGSPVAEYSDEAWSRLVDGISGQHAGRLRRAFERFGEVREVYPSLYWSHFQAALDWDDADMWLEGAKQSGWTVAQMRSMRWETLGKREEDRPRPEDVVAEEEEAFEPGAERLSLPDTITGEYGEVTALPDMDCEPDEVSRSSAPGQKIVAVDDELAADPSDQFGSIRPFADLPDLPDDLTEAFDSFKLAILRYKTDGWREISAAHVLQSLEALKALVTAP